MTRPTPAPGENAPEGSDSPLVPTHIRCIECDTYQRVGDPDVWTECDTAVMEGEDHPVEFLLLSPTPLGYADDEDHYAGGIKMWVYDAKEPA